MTALKILIATDAWLPQVNGVARTLEWLAAELRACGVDVVMLTPEGFPTFEAPSYPGLRIALPAPSRIARYIEDQAPDAIHIATEGPVGFMTRRHCLRSGRKFTTCYHTRFPEYLSARWPLPLSWSYAALRGFHNASAATMVSSLTLRNELAERGFSKLTLWQRGIPVKKFSAPARPRHEWPRPAFLYVGRVAIEKNIAAFLDLDLPGAKIVVGDGPQRSKLQEQYPEVIFTGRLEGEDLANAYQSADAMVFPSLTDTFGLVMLEALTAGLPVAAFPVAGPRDILAGSGCGVMNEDLRTAALAALQIPRDTCRTYGESHGMEQSARSFLNNVATALNLKLPTG